MKSHQIYCVSCHQGKTMIGATPVVMKNGSLAVKGQCPKCSNMAYRIVRKDEITRKKTNLMPIVFHSLMFLSGISIGIIITRLFG